VTRLDTDPGIGADPDPAPEPVTGPDTVAELEPYQLRVSYDAQRVLTQAPPVGLPSRQAWAAYRFVTGELPRDPTSAGVALGAALTGVWSARQPGYRVLYEVDEQHRVVTVLVIRPDA
jgi:mRNA-degrading endonuclease RelE of RelBE toxin-antitoxin system